ncbi:MAG: glycosyltransferase family 4 protein [Chloroflexota bacterium]|nr:glycosyltransferase family 4 protein [Chloroflexota bacterium]
MSKAPQPGRRIAIVVHASFPADPRIRREADALLAAGYEVDVFALRDPDQPAEERIGALRILRLPVRRRFVGFAGHMAEYLAFAGLAAIRLTREHRRRSYALVQVATLPDFLVVAAAALKLAGVPLLLDLHEDMPAFFDDRFASPPLRPMRPVIRGVARASAAMADAVITVHEPLRELALARGVAPDKISVVMNSPDDRIFDPSGQARRTFMDGELRLIHHSSLQRIYGLEVALRAVAAVGESVRLRLDVYGDGPYRPQIEQTIAALDVGDRVELHGRVAMDELPRLLAGSDVAVVPSLPEPYLQLSLSTKLLEAVAMGVPVIASDLATFRAHFSPDAIRYVPGGDPIALASAITELADDPDRAAALAQEAREQARPYAWPVQAARYLEVVDRLVTRRR